MHTEICRMTESLGRSEQCPGEECPFWGRNGCGFEQLDFRGRSAFASFLLDLRSELEALRDAEGENAARSRFFARLNAGHSG
jgi:hypothetical protein